MMWKVYFLSFLQQPIMMWKRQSVELFLLTVPEIMANHPEASLIHEAAIGKIAGEQLTKLMTLGLTEKEAEEQIIGGFLK